MGKIRQAKTEDVSILKKIVDESISYDFYSEDYIKEFICNENTFVHVYVEENDVPLGCLFCEKGDLKHICDIGGIPYPDESFEGYNDNTKTIIYKTAATAISSRKRGILTEFLEKAENECRDIEHTLKVCLCCINPAGVIPVKNHVERNGFIQKKRFKSPWIKIKSYCYVCKKDYCECDGVLFMKENNCGKEI